MSNCVLEVHIGCIGPTWQPPSAFNELMEVPFEGGSKSESVPIDPHIEMPRFTAEVSMFAASLFWSLLIIYPFMTVLWGIHFYTTHAFKLDYSLKLCKVKSIAALSVSTQALFYPPQLQHAPPLCPFSDWLLVKTTQALAKATILSYKVAPQKLTETTSILYTIYGNSFLYPNRANHNVCFKITNGKKTAASHISNTQFIMFFSNVYITFTKNACSMLLFFMNNNISLMLVQNWISLEISHISASKSVASC